MSARGSMDRRLRAVDWLLLLLLLGGAILGGRYWLVRRSASMPTVTVEYTVLVTQKDIRADWEFYVPIGTEVLSANGTASMGRVVAVTSRAHLAVSVAEEELVFSAHPQKQELLIRIRSEAGDAEGDCLRVQDIRVGVGMRGDYRIGGLLAENAQIVSLIVIDAE